MTRFRGLRPPLAVGHWSDCLVQEDDPIQGIETTPAPLSHRKLDTLFRKMTRFRGLR